MDEIIADCKAIFMIKLEAYSSGDYLQLTPLG